MLGVGTEPSGGGGGEPLYDGGGGGGGEAESGSPQTHLPEYPSS